MKKIIFENIDVLDRMAKTGKLGPIESVGYVGKMDTPPNQTKPHKKITQKPTPDEFSFWKKLKQEFIRFKDYFKKNHSVISVWVNLLINLLKN